MGFLKTLFRRSTAGYTRKKTLLTASGVLMAAFLVVGGMVVFSEQVRAACCGGICGTCTVAVYVYSFTASPTGYTYGNQAIASWSSNGDYCVLNGGNWSNTQVPGSGNLGTGLLNPGSYNMSIQCVDTGGATQGVSGAYWIGVTVCPTNYTWNGSSCQPPAHPTESITIDCASPPNLDACSGASNNHGTIHVGDTLAVRTSYSAQPGDALVATAIIKSPADTGLSSPISPDNYYGAATRRQPAVSNDTFNFTPTAAEANHSYYFYPVSASNFYAWDDHTPGSVAYITVRPAFNCSFNPSSALTVSAGQNFTLAWNPVNGATSASLKRDTQAGGQSTTLHTLTAGEMSSGGSFGVTAPTTPGTYQYYIAISNAYESDICERWVTVGAATSNITIAASPTSVVEGNSSIVTISRTSPTTADQAVTYTRGGTGTYTTDWALVNNTCTNFSTSGATIPAGQSSCQVKINTVADSVTDAGETASLTISGASGATVGSPSTATVTMSDSGSGDMCTDITGTQSSVPSGCQTPSPNPGSCIPSGYTWNGSSCTAPAASISIDANDPTIAKGSSGSLTVQAKRTGGSATVIMPMFVSWSGGTPTGVTEGGFSPSSCTPGTIWASCSSETLTVSNSATPGTYYGTMYFSDGSTYYTDPFSLTISGAASFAFSIYPYGSPTATVAPGSEATVQLVASLDAGSASSIGSFFTTGQPTGMTINFSPASCTPPSTSCTTMYIDATPDLTPDTYPVYVYASGGGANATTLVYVTVGATTGGSLTVGIATEDDAGEPGTGQGSGNFTLTRTGGPNGTSLDLPVQYEISGTATYGVDYTLDGDCGSITDTGAIIRAGFSSCDIEIVPIDDSLQEGTETVTITPIPVTASAPN